MDFPENLRYTKEHEWVRLEKDGSVVTGITDYAQDQLGDIVFVQLPEPSEEYVDKDEPFAEVESVKAVSDIYCPVAGKVVEVNSELPLTPEVLNEDPYGDGWLVRIEPAEEDFLDELMDVESYRAFVDELT
ncbi:MAG: glycine cleavage system protein GcvH [Candidatus Binatia bacterium]